MQKKHIFSCLVLFTTLSMFSMGKRTLKLFRPGATTCRLIGRTIQHNRHRTLSSLRSRARPYVNTKNICKIGGAFTIGACFFGVGDCQTKKEEKTKKPDTNPLPVTEKPSAQKIEEKPKEEKAENKWTGSWDEQPEIQELLKKYKSELDGNPDVKRVEEIFNDVENNFEHFSLHSDKLNAILYKCLNISIKKDDPDFLEKILIFREGLKGNNSFTKFSTHSTSSTPENITILRILVKHKYTFPTHDLIEIFVQQHTNESHATAKDRKWLWNYIQSTHNTSWKATAVAALIRYSDLLSSDQIQKLHNFFKTYHKNYVDSYDIYWFIKDLLPVLRHANDEKNKVLLSILKEIQPSKQTSYYRCEITWLHLYDTCGTIDFNILKPFLDELLHFQRHPELKYTYKIEDKDILRKQYKYVYDGWKSWKLPKHLIDGYGSTRPSIQKTHCPNNHCFELVKFMQKHGV